MTGTERIREARDTVAARLGPNWRQMLDQESQAMSARDRILLLLDTDGDWSVTDIATELRVSRSRVTQLVKALEKRGQVVGTFETDLPEVLGRPQKRLITLTNAGRVAADVVRKGGWKQSPRVVISGDPIDVSLVFGVLQREAEMDAMEAQRTAAIRRVQRHLRPDHDIGLS